MYKSPLEAYCAKKLDEANIPFSYEKRTYTLQKAFKPTFELYERYKKRGQSSRQLQPKNYKVRKITYTPDFVGINDRWIIEVKGHKTPQFQIRFKLFLKYIQDRIDNGTMDKILILVPRNKKEVDMCVDLIKKIDYEQREEPKSSN